MPGANKKTEDFTFQFKQEIPLGTLISSLTRLYN